MTNRLSLPTSVFKQTETHYTDTPSFKYLRPGTWPSYFRRSLQGCFTPAKPSLPSFLHRDTWSLSSLGETTRPSSTFSMRFPPVPDILWHLHPRMNPSHTIESPPCQFAKTAIDLPKNKTFHTQSLLFLFGFLFFPCWWLGWYLSKEPPMESYYVVNHIFHDSYCYSRFNRLLSFVSFFFLLLILGLLIWSHWGTLHHWWV